jgi:group I intron endonuclease
MVINKAILKHGISNFILEILEYCEPENAIDRENHYFKTFNQFPEYNILKKAGSSLGYKHSKESLEKMKNTALGNKNALGHNWSGARKGEANPFYGKTHSEEAKKKMATARSGIKHSEQTRSKIGESNGTSVKVTDTDTGIAVEYSSKRQAARELNTSLDTIRRYITSKNLLRGRYLIEIC